MINAHSEASKAVISWLTPDGVSPEQRVFLAAQSAGYLLFDQSAAKRRCDIAVVDLRGFLEPSPAIADLVDRARSLSPAAGLIIAASAGADRKLRALLRRHGDVHFLGRDAAPLIASVRERLRLFSLADEMGERMKSLVADGRTISFSGFEERRDRVSVLVAGNASPLTLNVCNAVNRVAAHTSCVFTAGQVMRALDHYKFDCAIFLPSGESDLLIALARALRRHRDHRKLSVFMASADDDLLDRCASKEGFDVILANHLDSDLAPRLETAARRARMASAMRSFLRSTDGCGGKSGAAGARFFAHHTSRLYKCADAAEKNISLVGLSLEFAAGDGPDSAGAALNEALRTVAKLVRAEDLITKLTPSMMVISVRGANATDAAKIAERLEGVIGGTLTRSAHGVTEVLTATATREPDEHLETNVARLLRDLRSKGLGAASVG